MNPKYLKEKSGVTHDAAIMASSLILKKDECFFCDSVVSRLYYSVFQYAYQIALDEGFSYDKDKKFGFHESVIEHLNKKDKFKPIIQKIMGLKSQRRKADYTDEEFQKEQIKSIVANAIECREFLEKAIKS